MKNLLLITLLFIALQPVAGQTDSVVTKPTFNNQLEFHIEFVAFSFGYNHRIYHNWFLGFNLGLGAGVRLGIFPEVGHFSVIIQHITSNNFKYEIAPTIAGYHNLNVESPESDLFFGANFGFFYGKKVQLGAKVSVGLFSGDTFGVTPNRIHFVSSLIILKIPIKW